MHPALCVPSTFPIHVPSCKALTCLELPDLCLKEQDLLPCNVAHLQLMDTTTLRPLQPLSRLVSLKLSMVPKTNFIGLKSTTAQHLSQLTSLTELRLLQLPANSTLPASLRQLHLCFLTFDALKALTRCQVGGLVGRGLWG